MTTSKKPDPHIQVCASFGRTPAQLAAAEATHVATNSAQAVSVLGVPIYTVSSDMNEIPERVTLIKGLDPAHAQALAQKLADRALPLRLGPLDTDQAVGDLFDFIVQENGELTAALDLTPSARREYRGHAGPAGVAPVIVPDKYGMAIDVLAAVWLPPQGAALNAARGATRQYTEAEVKIAAMFGRRPEDLSE